MDKNEQTKTTFKKVKLKTTPVLKELGMVAAKGIVSGLSFRLGGMMYDKSFTRSSRATIHALPGGKNVANG